MEWTYWSCANESHHCHHLLCSISAFSLQAPPSVVGALNTETIMIQKNITNNNNLFQHHQAKTRYSAPINPKLQHLPSPKTPQTFELLKTGYVLLYIYIDTGYPCSHHKRAGVNSLQYTNVHPRFGEERCGHVAILDWPTGLCGALWRHAVFVIIIIFQSSAVNSDKKKKTKEIECALKGNDNFF